MPARTTHFKLGVLAISVTVGLLAIGLALGLRATRDHTTAYHTYFDETVHGLELGAPVKFRGVRIGSVDAIAIAPDGKLVDVTLEISEDAARRLELDTHRPALRAQLGYQGLTGLKLVDLDVFPDARPPPALAFPPPAHYIPSQPSLVAGLERGASEVSDRLPAVLDRTTRVLDQLDAVMAQLADARIPERVGATLDASAAAVGHVRALVADLDRAQIGTKAAATLAAMDQTLARIDALVDDLGPRVRRAADAVGDVGRATARSAGDLDRTLRDLGEAARSFRELVDDIQREPDMLLKGRKRTR